MSSKTEKDKAKQLQDKCQSVLNALLRDEDNKYCVDCDSKGPRWASWNLGVFLCIRCAGIHRNLGVHISKVKSVNLDAWTPEQVVSLQQMGNSRARAVYEANIPDNFRRPQNDSALETFIRAKYEHKKYIAREWKPPVLPEVNWEKEIDEEIERQKRKKKSAMAENSKISLGAVEVPQLPKPKSSNSPKPGRTVPPPVTAASVIESSKVANNSATTDLLGLTNGDDSFSNFLSATPNSNEKEAANSTVDPAKSEEESFFNQTAPTEKEKAKLTKDSILALYGTAPNNTPMFNNYQYAPPAQQGFPYQSPPMQYQFNAQPPQQQAMPTQFQQFNQLPPMGGGGMVPPSGVQPMQMMQQPNQFIPTNQFAQQQQPNPFFNQQQQPSYQMNLQQQFGGLNLNANPADTGAQPPLAGNVWQ